MGTTDSSLGLVDKCHECMLVTCQVCQGRNRRSTTCTECDGTGRCLDDVLYVDWVECKRCSGTGTVDVRCPLANRCYNCHVNKKHR